MPETRVLEPLEKGQKRGGAADVVWAGGSRPRAWRSGCVARWRPPWRGRAPQFRPARADRLLVADISNVQAWGGWLFPAVILDAFSCRVVGWALADHLRTELATAALQMALASRRPGPRLIHHSDRGCQYTAGAYAGVLGAHGIAQSLGRLGTCWDNAVPESFFATKTELIYRHVWTTKRQARTAIFEFIEGFYNRRHHSTLGYASSVDFEAIHQPEVPAA